MPTLITRPTRITDAADPPIVIEEYVGRLNSGEAAVSIARLRGPAGWSEPGQTPDFDEYSLVFSGVLRVESRGGSLDVGAGSAKCTSAKDNHSFLKWLGRLRRVQVLGSLLAPVGHLPLDHPRVPARPPGAELLAADLAQ